MSDESRLSADLRAWVERAREQGRLGELAGELRAALGEALAARVSDQSASADVPMRLGMVGDSPAMTKVFESFDK